MNTDGSTERQAGIWQITPCISEEEKSHSAEREEPKIIA
jgi:hypothetical protein